MGMSPESGYTTAAQREPVTKVTAFTNSTSGIYCPPPIYSAGTPQPIAPTAGDELKYLDNELGTLFTTIDSLERKLEAVLTPPGPDSDGSCGAPFSASPLVLKLKDQTALLVQANHRLGVLLSRIEL